MKLKCLRVKLPMRSIHELSKKKIKVSFLCSKEKKLSKQQSLILEKGFKKLSETCTYLVTTAAKQADPKTIW